MVDFRILKRLLPLVVGSRMGINGRSEVGTVLQLYLCMYVVVYKYPCSTCYAERGEFAGAGDHTAPDCLPLTRGLVI